MDQNENYQYKFQYSLASYHPLCREEVDQDDDFCEKDEQNILRKSNELVDYKCFAEKQTEDIIKTLFTHYIQLYGRTAVRLFRICEINHQNADMSSSCFIRNCQEFIENQRQKLVENLSEFTQIFYNQKDKYFKLISLCVSGSIFKILKWEKQADICFETVFHNVYWELTGMHSTNQMLESIKEKTLVNKNFVKYLANEKPLRVMKPKFITQSVRNSSSFGNGFYANDCMMNFSIRDPESKLCFNKLNQKQKEGTTFSKMIKRKQKGNKQNSGFSLNENSGIQVLKPKTQQIQTKFNQVQAFKLAKQQYVESSEKAFNFKKDRVNIFENYSKSKSGKKLFAQFQLSGKKLTFASYLQKKRLF